MWRSSLHKNKTDYVDMSPCCSKVGTHVWTCAEASRINYPTCKAGIGLACRRSPQQRPLGRAQARESIPTGKLSSRSSEPRLTAQLAHGYQPPEPTAGCDSGLLTAKLAPETSEIASVGPWGALHALYYILTHSRCAPAAESEPLGGSGHTVAVAPPGSWERPGGPSPPPQGAAYWSRRAASA